MNRLFVASVVLALFSLGCESNKDDFFMRMTTQPKYKYYQQSEFWQDGRAMRTPPPGTISREMRDELPLKDWKNADGVYASNFPAALKVTPELIQHGQHKFTYLCANCHGINGDGHSIVGENMALHPAPSLVALKDRPVGYFVEVASNGYGLMPNFAGELNLEDRWAVAAYVKSLQLSQGVPFDQLPPDIQQKVMSQPQMPPEQEHHGEQQQQKETP
ncbi:MAG: c-type cytochrome [Myxococcaceae bacterium]